MHDTGSDKNKDTVKEQFVTNQSLGPDMSRRLL